jgi:hypothetical protein
VPITVPPAAPTPAPRPPPIAAPRAAPSRVPTTALPTTALLACSGPAATCVLAKFLHTTSSSAKASKGLPGAGSTVTVGPSGGVVQALKTRGMTANATLIFIVLPHAERRSRASVDQSNCGVVWLP